MFMYSYAYACTALQTLCRLEAVWHRLLSTFADQRCRGNYTAQYAPPEMIKVRTSSAPPPVAVHGDIWALGVMFHQMLTAACQRGSLFLPDLESLKPVLAAKDPVKLSEAMHAVVDSAQDAWVRCCAASACHSLSHVLSLEPTMADVTQPVS